MPKYRVKIRQWVEEVAEVELYADGPKNMWSNLQQLDEDGELDPDWRDGSEIKGPEIVSSKKIGD